MDKYGNLDSKYRFIILASKRAKQLLKGAKPKIEAKSRNPIRIAQTEVRSGLIDYEIIPSRLEDIPDREDRVFVGGEIGDEAVEPEAVAAKDLTDEGAEIDLGEEEEDEGTEDEEESELSDDDLKADKDD